MFKLDRNLLSGPQGFDVFGNFMQLDLFDINIDPLIRIYFYRDNFLNIIPCIGNDIIVIFVRRDIDRLCLQAKAQANEREQIEHSQPTAKGGF